MRLTNRRPLAAAARGAAASIALLPLAMAAHAQSAADASGSDWRYSLSVYGYFPSLSGDSSTPTSPGGPTIDVSAGNIVDALKFTFMGSLGAHNGRYGFFTDALVGLAHVRLSIIDLAGGAQPMANEDGSVVVSYNGEVYNYRELAAELETRGHRFHSHCDTEVLVHGWEEWGPGLFQRLNGQFAFALYDRRAEQVILARDRFGVRVAATESSMTHRSDSEVDPGVGASTMRRSAAVTSSSSRKLPRCSGVIRSSSMTRRPAARSLMA